MPFSFGIKSFFSPQDDIQAEIIKEVQNAKETIFIAIYAFHLPPLTDLLIEKHKAGIEIHCILDLSQSKGIAEKPEVEKLVEAGIDTVIGTSPEAHQIMHEKGMCIDGYHVITGSYNFSTSAAEQVNHMDFIYSKDRADWFATFFNNLRAWIVKNEPQDQPKKD
jgi:phosphatidylserine/phosphatidylglycerophosphate/cardiolipin synthase-like enzyme